MNKSKLQAMMKCTYHDKYVPRPALEGLAFKHEHGKNFMCTTDGYVLVYVPLPEDFNVEDRVIDPVAIKQYLITLKPKEEVDIKAIYELKRVDALYPYVLPLFPAEDTATTEQVIVNPRLLSLASAVLDDVATMTCYKPDKMVLEDESHTKVIVMGLTRG